MSKPTVRKHIENMIKWYWNNRKLGFRTRDIQSLSERGIELYGRRLGSPSTYERTFRQLRQDGMLTVQRRTTRLGENQASWIIKEIK